jgi:hypothetical protein
MGAETTEEAKEWYSTRTQLACLLLVKPVTKELF